MANCPKCGTQLNNGASFCTKCGTQIQDSNAIPTFTPPADNAPVFTPPTRNFDGPVCYHHQDEPAAAQCARCGKYICKDCAEAYTVGIGEYANQCLCFDCCQAIVAENVEVNRSNKSKITTTFVMTIVGMVIGLIVGLSAGGGFGLGLLLMVIGGCFWTFLKGWFKRIGGALAGGGFNLVSFLIGLVLGFFIEAVLSIYRTIRKIIECIIYLKKTAGFIEEDSVALQQMKDYMEYTQVMSRNRGVDLETLMGQGSELYNNAYAQMVNTQGEAAADAMLRQCTTTIAENGEIIRNFAA